MCRGFGYNDDAGAWRVDRHPRFLADITGDGRVDIVGFGGPGVHVARNLHRRFRDPVTQEAPTTHHGTCARPMSDCKRVTMMAAKAPAPLGRGCHGRESRRLCRTGIRCWAALRLLAEMRPVS